MSSNNAIAFNLELANAYGSGMVDAQQIAPYIDAENAHRCTVMPDHVPTVDKVESAIDAYQLGLWTESTRMAKEYVRTGRTGSAASKASVFGLSRVVTETLVRLAATTAHCADNNITGDDAYSRALAFRWVASVAAYLSEQYPIYDDEDVSRRESEASHAAFADAWRFFLLDNEEASNMDSDDVYSDATENESRMSFNDDMIMKSVLSVAWDLAYDEYAATYANQLTLNKRMSSYEARP